jgi:hypothetical protein
MNYNVLLDYCNQLKKDKRGEKELFRFDFIVKLMNIEPGSLVVKKNKNTAEAKGEFGNIRIEQQTYIQKNVIQEYGAINYESTIKTEVDLLISKGMICMYTSNDEQNVIANYYDERAYKYVSSISKNDFLTVNDFSQAGVLPDREYYFGKLVNGEDFFELEDIITGKVKSR